VLASVLTLNIAAQSLLRSERMRKAKNNNFFWK